MTISSIILPRSRRSLLSLVVSAALFCPSAAPQGAPDIANGKISSKTLRDQEIARGDSLQAGSEFLPAGWSPPDVDDTPAAVTSPVTCPMSRVLQRASQHAVEFAENLDRFTATEVILSAQARKDGNWNRLQASTFNYMAFVTRPRANVVYVDERRDASVNSTSPPQPIQTTGLAVTALIFHPHKVSDFAMACEGMGEWHGKPAWMVHFAQRAEIPPHFQSIHIKGKWFDVKLKGRAWISTDNYEIEHIDSDLLEPIPQIRLLKEHTSIDYGSIGFSNGNSRLWLPQFVDFYMDMEGHRFFNHHRLSNFLLFSVETKQETQAPRLPEQ